MKKKLVLMLTAALLVSSPVSVLADEKDDRIQELEAQVTEMQATIDDLQKQLEEALAKVPAGTDQSEYKIGETWVVENQWKLTVTSVEETSYRNEYDDRNPAAVYIVNYEYENLGFEQEGWNGLALYMEDGIVDNAGSMGYGYPGEITYYPQETPVGAKCTAQACIGVDNAGSFKINFSTYDGNSQNQTAVFNIEL